jgi:hypothetical protein
MPSAESGGSALLAAWDGALSSKVAPFPFLRFVSSPSTKRCSTPVRGFWRLRIALILRGNVNASFLTSVQASAPVLALQKKTQWRLMGFRVSQATLLLWRVESQEML